MIDVKGSVTPTDCENMKDRLLQPDCALFCLNAEFHDLNGVLFDDLEEEQREYFLTVLVKLLKTIELPPNDIFIFDGNGVYVHAQWYPPVPLILKTAENYIRLLENLQRYIDTISFSQGEVVTDVWDYSPVHVDDDMQLFNSLFGISTKIETVLLTEKPKPISVDLDKIYVYDFRSNQNNDAGKPGEGIF